MGGGCVGEGRPHGIVGAISNELVTTLINKVMSLVVPRHTLNTYGIERLVWLVFLGIWLVGCTPLSASPVPHLVSSFAALLHYQLN